MPPKLRQPCSQGWLLWQIRLIQLGQIGSQGCARLHGRQAVDFASRMRAVEVVNGLHVNAGIMDSKSTEPSLCVKSSSVLLSLSVEARTLPLALSTVARTVRALSPPVARRLRLSSSALSVRVRSFRFDPPAVEAAGVKPARRLISAPAHVDSPVGRTRLRPPPNVLTVRERLFYSLQPPIETWVGSRAIDLPAPPFPYQVQGIAFLVPRYAALLGDEMGLGKTMQAIVAARILFAVGLIHSMLIVCPKPLVSNWVRELATWAGDLPVTVVEGCTGRRYARWRVPNMPVKIVNYELLARDIGFLEEAGVEFDLVVLDEAQRIKNRHAQTAKAVWALRRQRSWALTGTPLENSPEDLISIFAFLEPGLIRGTPSISSLRRTTEPYIMRRLKEQVLHDLPEKIIRDAYIDLTPAQRETYRLAEQRGILQLNQLGNAVSIQNVFELILRLKQICNFDPVTGDSAKLEQLRADLEQVASSGRKALVFSQWVGTLQRLNEQLSEFRPLELHGSIRPADRLRAMEQFKREPGRYVLLLSYGAGGVGLNLQHSQYVFLFDRWWNPAVEDQAIDRAYRIGQKHTVFVTRFVATGTIEERINEVLEQKRALAAELVPGGDGLGKLGMTEAEIFGLFDLQVPARRAA